MVIIIKLLIVDDEKDIRNLIKLYLSNENYEFVEAENGLDALSLISSDIDLVLLDVMMPKMDGIQTCLNIRDNFNMPILFLTAKIEDTDKLTGFLSGADDYISKPFNPIDLVARVKANIRRYKNYSISQSETTSKILLNEITVDLSSHVVCKNNDVINLTKTEFYILKLLIENRGKVYSLEQIYNTVWKSESVLNSESTVSVHIRNLREKLEDDLSHPKYIKTVWGVGYRVD
ncbi:response regulator transcription factor [Carnobacterium inhibens]|uniref:response regulator transcription factor n=1 Tax=Carnobacterium inhibens TaxID=147709 RepID=UPI0006901219|nr:response regulator transcription factor [Carnobacterium inhibens]